jgi:hypothetical protein
MKLAKMRTITTQLSALLLLFCVSWVGTVQAQETTVAIPAVSAEAGESVQVPVDVDAFNDIGAVTLVVTYDSDVLTFNGLENAARPQFEANVPSEGELRISWFDQSGTNPINLGTGKLLDMNFAYSSGSTTLTFDEGQSEIANAQATPIEVNYEAGRVASTIGEVALGSVTDASLGQTITIPVSAQGFTSSIGSASLSIAFDADVLQFEALSDQSGLNLSAGSPQEGIVNVGGFSTDGVTPDGEIAQLEFTYYGGSSTLNLSDSEVTDTTGADLPTQFTSGAVSGVEPTVSLSSENAVLGDTLSVPVQVENLTNVGAVSLSIEYNGAVLSFVGSANNNFGDELQIDNPSAGVLNIGGFNTAGADLTDQLVDLQFAATAAGTSPLTFDVANSEVTNPSGTAYNVAFGDGEVSVTEGLLLGDVNANGSVDAGDATLVLRSLVDAVSLSSAQQEAADVDGDGEPTAADASFILQFVVGSIDQFPAQASASVKAGDRATGALELGAPMSREEQNQVVVPVQLSDVNGSLTAAELSLSYDASAFGVEAVQTVFPSEWTAVHNVKDGEGVVKIAAAGTSSLAEGTIARITLTSLEGSDPTLRGEARLNGQATQTISATPTAQTPEAVTLDASYPNPFTTSTTISYGLPDDTEVTLEVFNILGQKVATLVDGKQSAGRHEVVLDASNLSSGTYLYRVEAGGVTKSGRMTVVK